MKINHKINKTKASFLVLSLLLLIILLISQTSAAQTSQCIDYDNGIKIYSNSIVISKAGNTWRDSCKDQNTVREMSCFSSTDGTSTKTFDEAYITSLSCPSGYKCGAGQCAKQCIPKTCSELNKQCGTQSDSCGMLINCGSCQEGSSCSNGICETDSLCTPQSCSYLGVQCEYIEDECGILIDCGTCPSEYTCSAGSCVKQCTDSDANPPAKEYYTLGTTRGYINSQLTTKTDECISSTEVKEYSCTYSGIDAGKINEKTFACPSGSICSNGACDSTGMCFPLTCAQLGKFCGTYDDGCDNTLNCGGCGLPGEYCVNGVCQQCTPKTCSQLGKQCGIQSDGCGMSINCGSCLQAYSPDKEITDIYITNSYCPLGTLTFSEQEISLGSTIKLCGKQKATTLGDSVVTSSLLQFNSCPEGYISSSTSYSIGSNNYLLHLCVKKAPLSVGNTIITQPYLQTISCPAGSTLKSSIVLPNGAIMSYCEETRIVQETSSSCSAAGACISQCIPLTCSQLGQQCGSRLDDCGGTLNCGSCPSGQECRYGKCESPCIPESTSRECGTYINNCGQLINLGSCNSAYGVCDNSRGVCVPFCTDTDAGANYYIKGTVTGYLNGIKTFNDECLSNFRSGGICS